MTSNDEMIELYGPAATHSEHSRFDYILYLDQDRRQQSGTIIWIQAPGAGHGIRYVVEPAGRPGFPDFIAPGDVIS